MDFRRLTWHEFVALGGGLVFVLALFLPWYHGENERATVGGMSVPDGGADFTGWETHTLLRWLYLAAVAAPLILTYIVVRGHALSWARGEMTAVIAIAVFGLVGYNGLIERPGEPSGLVSTSWGLWLALLGILLMMGGSALRASESERPRKPPGVM